MRTKTLLAVVGPTAIGKTELAILLAIHYNTEILSADSRQFYKEMCIGTAVPEPIELASAPHHFIQHISIKDSYSVGDYERDALGLLDRLFTKHDTVVLVGGSGLYVDAVVNGLDDFPDVSPLIREQLQEQLKRRGIVPLQRQLMELDPTYYAKVDLTNHQRVIRALEICIGSGKPYSSFLSNKKKERPFKTIYIGLTAPRELVYARIGRRVNTMMKKGLLEEVTKLYEHRERNALQTVGYRELFSYLDGDMVLDDAVEEIKKNTRRFAKRQLTWYRKREDILWFRHSVKFPEVIQALEEYKTQGTR